MPIAGLMNFILLRLKSATSIPDCLVTSIEINML